MEDEPPSTDSPRGSLLQRVKQRLCPCEIRSVDQMKSLVRQATETEVFPVSTGGLIDSVLDFHDLRVRDVMVPRGQMDVIEEGTTLPQLLSAAIETGHSRYPVIRSNRDEVIGILLVKELLRFYANSQEQGGDETGFDLLSLVRTPMFVPESKRLDALLAEFRLTRTHMAIVLDEFGGVAGLVTIEDVLEEIVGDIDDEFDVEERVNIRQQAPRRHTVRALTPIGEFNEVFGTDFSDDEYDTIGGLVSNTLGHLPRRGEVARLGEYEFKVLGADRRRLHLLLVTKLDFEPSEDADGASASDEG
ncbi:CBS domain-containing protein [Guyparkeria halophila]|uniref:Magnesium and cobalt efflux protein CorC n=2 Tax=Thioalkalibacteraceae TaxID=2035710 RepID=A0A6I6D0R3_9GAMM|nr:CBS domain-containing protein [Guyparkeria halophila]TKA91190.1 CBS domain-containing protein [Guyparkeria sp. SB14A]